MTAAPELLFPFRASPSASTAVPIDNLINLCYYEYALDSSKCSLSLLISLNARLWFTQILG